MYKKLSFLVILLALPHVAVAQLVELPVPLSSFVGQVLKRVDSVFSEYISALSASTKCDLDRQNAIEIALADVRTSIDTSYSLIRQADALQELSLCQKYDLDILEARMVDVRDIMVLAADECELSTLKTLGDVHQLLNQAYESLLKGGLDPMYVDFQLRQNKYFGDGDPEAQACPFHSDYAPTSIARSGSSLFSFGCDKTVLQLILEQDLAKLFQDNEDAEKIYRSEAENIIKFINASNEAAVSLGSHILDFDKAIRSVLRTVRGTPLPQPVTPEMPPHGETHGCMSGVILNLDTGKQEIFKVTTREREEPLSKHLLEDFFDDFDYSILDLIKNKDELPRGLLLRALHDNFSIYDNTINTLKNFMQVKEMQGRERPLPFGSGFILLGSGASLAEVREAQDWTLQFGNADANFAREEAVLKATSNDAIDQMLEAMSPLRKAVYAFGRSGSFPPPNPSIAKEYLPYAQAFTRDLALFIRRSCVWSYCNNTLDSVLKRLLNPYCTPYARGLYRVTKKTPDGRTIGYVEFCYTNELYNF